MAKKNKNMNKAKIYYDTSRMTDAEKYREIRRILCGKYDNWKSFGCSGGLCSGK